MHVFGDWNIVNFIRYTIYVYPILKCRRKECPGKRNRQNRWLSVTKLRKLLRSVARMWSIENMNDSACHLYTGLGSKAKFYFVLSTLGPARNKLNYYHGNPPSLSVDDQFLLTLMKLRTHPTNLELSVNFNISEKMVSNIFVTWISFMYQQWSEIDWWSSQNIVRFHSPEQFKKT